MEVYAQRAYKIEKFLEGTIKNRLVDRDIKQKLYISSRKSHKVIEIIKSYIKTRINKLYFSRKERRILCFIKK
jgi:hypothetical protein